MGRPKVKSYPWYPGTLASEYGVQYWEKKAPKNSERNAIKERQRARYPDVPHTETSTNRAEFQGRQGQPSKLVDSSIKSWPERRFNPDTTYNANHCDRGRAPPGTEAYMLKRSKQLDMTDYGTQCNSSYRDDYKGYDGAKPAETAFFPTSKQPARPFIGETDYNSNYTNKHSGRPGIVRPRQTLVAQAPFKGCTTYGRDYVEKPIPDRAAHCQDRPWMNCDSCKPSEAQTPNGSALQLNERSWTQPPFATGKAALDDRTEHKVSYQKW